ncbi:hypothetical protein E2C01_096442 [Portunus trituberculatus]|uniref:Uncharacterized protein n=1 Tax=Portunus trituberculatus TaxID=210409 RepID=A0A5B7K212_PORTR|nr:hypothetical protein [Portunus trituberculatus]
MSLCVLTPVTEVQNIYDSIRPSIPRLRPSQFQIPLHVPLTLFCGRPAPELNSLLVVEGRHRWRVVVRAWRGGVDCGGVLRQVAGEWVKEARQSAVAAVIMA